MLRITDPSLKFYLGVQGENHDQTITVDVKPWLVTYPNGIINIWHTRNGYDAPEPVESVFDPEEGTISWSPSGTDTLVSGKGEAQIRLYENDIIKKTRDIDTFVAPSSISYTGDLLSGWQAYIDHFDAMTEAAEDAQEAAEDAAEDAQDAADAAAAAAETYPYVDETTGNWMVYDALTEQYVNTGVHAQGPKGDPGSIENATAETIPMASDDPTTIAEKIATKADKVTGATAGHFAGLDTNGNLIDSSSKAADFLAANQGSGNAGKFMKVGLDGTLTPDNVPDPTGKADKVTGATSGNFAGLDSNGNLTDSGKKASDFIAANTKGTANGVAELDASGFVPSSQLPSFVDDVIEGYLYQGSFYEDSAHTELITPESGKVYVDISTNITYRWSGSAYVAIGSDLALGETSSTAYRGDRGKTAYDHATDSGRLTTAQTSGLYKIATTAEGHVASATEVQKSDITALGIPAQDTTYNNMTGASSSTAGAAGLAPAPAAGDQNKVLTGGGTWEESPGAKVVEVSGTITNTSGSYSGSISDERVVSGMKLVGYELGDPTVFNAYIEVTPGSGSVAISCSDVAGSSTIKIKLLKVMDDPTTMSSAEFDILENRIGDLTDLDTTAKTDIVAAINEHETDINSLNSKLTNNKGTVTGNSNYIINNNLKWSRYGNVVCVSGFFQTKADIPAGTTIFTLPYSAIAGGGCTMTTYNGDQIRALAWAEDSNTIELQTTSTSGSKWFYASFAYITSESA